MTATIIATFNSRRTRDRTSRWFLEDTYLVSFKDGNKEAMHTLQRKPFAPRSLFVQGNQVKLEYVHDILYALTVDMLQDERVSATLLLEDDAPGTLSSMYTFNSGPSMADYTLTKKIMVNK